MNKLLTKSLFLSGLQCARRPWLDARAPRDDEEPPGARRLPYGWAEVFELARRRFPAGVEIESDIPLAERVRLTAEAMARGAEVLFKGAFVSCGMAAVVDVLRRGAGGRWDLVAIRASTNVKDDHISDLAFQRLVVEGTGVEVGATYVKHINKDCIYPDLSNLFTLQDASDRVAEAKEDVRAKARELRRTLAAGAEPVVEVGPHCRQPDPCPHHERCWRGVDGPTVLDIPRLPSEKKASLASAGILRLEDLPRDFPLTSSQRTHVDAMLAATPAVDAAGIKALLDELAYPIHFLDFEADNPPVPRFAGTRPFEHVPFQLSCHVLHADGALEHRDYLHLERDDPRPHVARALAAVVGDVGSVVAYNATFERRIITGLARLNAQLAPRLESIASRLWDQAVVFKRHYIDPRFRGSYSLKTVSSALLPHLGYDDLEVRNGQEAVYVWNEMLDCSDEAERKRLAEALKCYCERDTYAMVELHRLLRSVASV